MKPKQQIKSIPPESGNKKNQNLIKPNQKPKRLKNNFKPDHHYTSNNKNDKIFNNTFYNRNEHNNKSNNKAVDVNASIKHGRNTSAPHLKDKKSNNKKVNKNINDYNIGLSPNKFNGNTIDVRDNVSFDKFKNHNQPKRQYNFNKNSNVNHRVNNIKQNYNSKTNKKYYNNDLNKYVTVKNDNYYNNYTSDSAKNKRRNQNIKSNNLSTLRGIKEKIELIRKQMNNKKSNDIGGLIGQRLKNNKQKSHNRYNYSFGKNSNLNNTINYNPVTKMNIGIIDHDDDDSNIEIDNEEKILKTDDHADFSQNNGDMERNYNTDYADITPTKKENDESNYFNNFNSIDTSSSKFASSNIKSQDYSKKYNNKNGLNMSGHSYNKKNDFVKKINIGTENNKFLFNNFAMYNNNRINTDKNKKKSKSKKIKIVSYPREEYHYNKSLNVFNTVNTKLNKSSISSSNYNRTIDTSHDKNLNKSKNKVNFGKKNNSVKRIKINNDVNKDIVINKLMAKRNMEKPKVKRENNKSLNYTFDKTDTSNKSKKNAPKMKNIKTVENTENIDNQENRVNQEIKQQEEIIKNEEIKKRKIEKIGCICHAGEISFGNPKINQDNYFNYKINTDDLVFMGVCDGHGENGHYVSEYLINHLPQDFNEAYIDLQQKEKKTFEDISLESITKTFEESFLKTDDDLNEFCSSMKKKKLIGENVPNYFNCDYSGSTCVSILLKQNDISKVYIANVGDSRTIVIRERDNNWTCKQLSRDHKPTEKDEYNRIIEADGEIEAIEDDNGNWTGPLRVWEKGSEGPGLAMTRSLGDKVGAKIGVVCTPEVFKYFIKEEDRAFIIASDGLWEYMNNQEVTNSVKELITNMRNNNENGEINADLISRELFNQSVERWRQKEQGIDDITIICVILN